ncbi:hypothetical protein [Pseudorhodoplanes sp.]|uniref:hypothetical protein n=1 Tax=Pseudorhodoplanes sp. TaxID=1934341 RepID=UPI002C1595A5|nr:hypothetical protein [Pseudorhodoplanes sp.]HWV51857.1 hypothetical protein [Pseudorhodoplanes sp.]
MAMTHTHEAPYPKARKRRRHQPRGTLWLPIAIFMAGVIVAGSWVTYILWPRWPAADMAVDAPTLPITVNGVNFNIPPAAIRNKVQRKPGTQERIDLVFLWPSLTPPDPSVKAGPAASAQAIDRVFVTVAAFGNTLPPIERFNTIYPRYLESSISSTPDGLTLRPFRDDSPYKGEDIIFSDRNPGRFMVRCTRDGNSGAAIGMCLFERRVDQTDITVRFPRVWLSDWPSVSEGLEKLIRQIRSATR